MKKFLPSCLSLATVCAVCLSVTSPHTVEAATVLAVDFGSTNIQSGFTNWAFPDGAGPQTKTFMGLDTQYVPTGSIVATLGGGSNSTDMSQNTGSMNFRFRPDPSPVPPTFTYSDLFRDRVVTTVGGTGAGLFLELTGLVAGASYDIQVWGVDTNIAATGVTGGAKPGNFQLVDWTTGSAVSLGSYSTTSAELPTSNDSFSVSGTIVADANGRIVVQSVSNMDGSGIMNGFVLSTSAIPEPARGGLLMGGLCWLFIRRRR